MSGDKQTEFRRALSKLSFLNTMIIHEKKEYIIYFQPMENKGKCKIQVTNGFDFWVEDFDYDKFELKRYPPQQIPQQSNPRKKCGLEGTYNSYFDMMSRAVQQRNFEVTVDLMQNFILVLYFQLNKGVSLKGEFELGRPLHFDDIKEFHCVYRLFLFDIFKVCFSQFEFSHQPTRPRTRNACESRSPKSPAEGAATQAVAILQTSKTKSR